MPSAPLGRKKPVSPTKSGKSSAPGGGASRPSMTSAAAAILMSSSIQSNAKQIVRPTLSSSPFTLASNEKGKTDAFRHLLMQSGGWVDAHDSRSATTTAASTASRYPDSGPPHSVDSTFLLQPVGSITTPLLPMSPAAATFPATTGTAISTMTGLHQPVSAAGTGTSLTVAEWVVASIATEIVEKACAQYLNKVLDRDAVGYVVGETWRDVESLVAHHCIPVDQGPLSSVYQDPALNIRFLGSDGGLCDGGTGGAGFEQNKSKGNSGGGMMRRRGSLSGAAVPLSTPTMMLRRTETTEPTYTAKAALTLTAKQKRGSISSVSSHDEDDDEGEEIDNENDAEADDADGQVSQLSCMMAKDERREGYPSHLVDAFTSKLFSAYACDDIDDYRMMEQQWLKDVDGGGPTRQDGDEEETEKEEEDGEFVDRVEFNNYPLLHSPAWASLAKLKRTQGNVPALQYPEPSVSQHTMGPDSVYERSFGERIINQHGVSCEKSTAAATVSALTEQQQQLTAVLEHEQLLQTPHLKRMQEQKTFPQRQQPPQQRKVSSSALPSSHQRPESSQQSQLRRTNFDYSVRGYFQNHNPHEYPATPDDMFVAADLQRCDRAAQAAAAAFTRKIQSHREIRFSNEPTVVADADTTGRRRGGSMKASSAAAAVPTQRSPTFIAADGFQNFNNDNDSLYLSESLPVFVPWNLQRRQSSIYAHSHHWRNVKARFEEDAKQFVHSASVGWRRATAHHAGGGRRGQGAGVLPDDEGTGEAVEGTTNESDINATRCGPGEDSFFGCNLSCWGDAGVPCPIPSDRWMTNTVFEVPPPPPTRAAELVKGTASAITEEEILASVGDGMSYNDTLRQLKVKKEVADSTGGSRPTTTSKLPKGKGSTGSSRGTSQKKAKNSTTAAAVSSKKTGNTRQRGSPLANYSLFYDKSRNKRSPSITEEDGTAVAAARRRGSGIGSSGNGLEDSDDESDSEVVVASSSPIKGGLGDTLRPPNMNKRKNGKVGEAKATPSFGASQKEKKQQLDEERRVVVDETAATTANASENSTAESDEDDSDDSDREDFVDPDVFAAQHLKHLLDVGLQYDAEMRSANGTTSRNIHQQVASLVSSGQQKSAANAHENTGGGGGDATSSTGAPGGGGGSGNLPVPATAERGGAPPPTRGVRVGTANASSIVMDGGRSGGGRVMRAVPPSVKRFLMRKEKNQVRATVIDSDSDLSDEESFPSSPASAASSREKKQLQNNNGKAVAVTVQPPKSKSSSSSSSSAMPRMNTNEVKRLQRQRRRDMIKNTYSSLAPDRVPAIGAPANAVNPQLGVGIEAPPYYNVNPEHVSLRRQYKYDPATSPPSAAMLLKEQMQYQAMLLNDATQGGDLNNVDAAASKPPPTAVAPLERLSDAEFEALVKQEERAVRGGGGSTMMMRSPSHAHTAAAAMAIPTPVSPAAAAAALRRGSTAKVVPKVPIAPTASPPAMTGRNHKRMSAQTTNAVSQTAR